MLRITLRTLLLLTLISSLGLAVLPTDHSVPHAAAQSEDTITIGLTDLPAILDPALVGDFMGWEILRHLYTGLTRQVPGTIEYELALAASHEVSADGLTHTFTIRDDAAFNDGTLVTAQTFVDSINRTLRLSRDGATILEDIGLQVEVTESGALAMTTDRPIPYFEALVSLPPFFAVDTRDFNPDEGQLEIQSLNGNGLFTLVEWDPGDVLRLAANSNYDYGEPPRTATIVLQNFGNNEDLRQALIAHEVDLSWRELRLPDADEAAQNVDGLRIESVLSSRMWYIIMNPFWDFVDDPVVRDSIGLIIDRERIVREDFAGYLDRAESLLPTYLDAAANPLWDFEPDVETAEQNLLNAGYRESRFNQVAIALQTSFETYGYLYTAVTSRIRRDALAIRVISISPSINMQADVFVQAVRRGDGPSFMFAWTPVVVHPHAYLYPLLHSQGLLATNNHIDDEAIDALLDQAALATSDDERNGLYREVQRLIDETDFVLPLWQDALYAVAWDDIGGITIEPNFFLHYELLERR